MVIIYKMKLFFWWFYTSGAVIIVDYTVGVNNNKVADKKYMEKYFQIWC